MQYSHISPIVSGIAKGVPRWAQARSTLSVIAMNILIYSYVATWTYSIVVIKFLWNKPLAISVTCTVSCLLKYLPNYRVIQFA